jgi:hypothetical protein
VLGQRGIADSEILARLAAEPDLVFLTQDDDFAALIPKDGGSVLISRVPQSLPIRSRVDLWTQALEAFLAAPPPGRLFELLADGEIVAWEIHEP